MNYLNAQSLRPHSWQRESAERGTHRFPNQPAEDIGTLTARIAKIEAAKHKPVPQHITEQLGHLAAPQVADIHDHRGFYAEYEQ